MLGKVEVEVIRHIWGKEPKGFSKTKGGPSLGVGNIATIKPPSQMNPSVTSAKIGHLSFRYGMGIGANLNLRGYDFPKY